MFFQGFTEHHQKDRNLRRKYDDSRNRHGLQRIKIFRRQSIVRLVSGRSQSNHDVFVAFHLRCVYRICHIKHCRHNEPHDGQLPNRHYISNILKVNIISQGSPPRENLSVYPNRSLETRFQILNQLMHDVFQVSESTSIGTKIKRTGILRHLHRELYQISKTLNHSLGKQLLFLFLKSFLIILTALYNLFSIHEKYDTIPLIIFMTQVVQIMTTYGLLVVLINHFCGTITAQVQSIRIIFQWVRITIDGNFRRKSALRSSTIIP